MRVVLSPDSDSVLDTIPGTVISGSGVHGLGLFATARVAEGEVLCLLDGQTVPWEEAALRAGPGVGCAACEWNAVEGGCLVRPSRTKYYYINHSRDPNLAVRPSPLRVVSLRSIAAGEELFLDYRCEPLPEAYVLRSSFL